MAEMLGTISAEASTDALGQEFGGYQLTGRAKQANDLLFKVNGLNAWTNLARKMSLRAGERFIIKHSDFGAHKESRRWYEQLGLREGDVKHKDGRIELLDHDQVAKLEERMDAETDLAAKDKLAAEFERDERVKVALNRFVDETILRPNAAVRPAWASDLRWMLVFHLQSFTFAFQERILKRIGSEALEGNYRPALNSLALLPVMFAADYLRDVIQGDDDEHRNRTFTEQAWHTADRAGMTGILQIGTDALQNLDYGGTGYESLLGPTVEQGFDMVRALSGQGELSDDIVRLLPGQNVYKKWDFLNLDGKRFEPKTLKKEEQKKERLIQDILETRRRALQIAPERDILAEALTASGL